MSAIGEPIKPHVKPHYSCQTISHVSLPVADLEKSIQFYDPVMATLGFTRLKTIPGITAGYGTYMSWGFWIGQAEDQKKLKDGENRVPGIHICLQAPSKKVNSMSSKFFYVFFLTILTNYRLLINSTRLL
jgi:catechol 2,3-dioxygenase-like lactoylglutathione lyase family enzyme